MWTDVATMDQAVELLQATVSSLFHAKACNETHEAHPDPERAFRALNVSGKGASPADLDDLFFSETPLLTISEYVVRLAQYMGCSATAVGVCAVLLHRLSLQRDSDRPAFTPETAYKIVLGALVVATKWTDDDHRGQTWFGECGGVSCEDVNLLEVAVLKGLRFRVMCTRDHIKDIEAVIAARPQAGVDVVQSRK